MKTNVLFCLIATLAGSLVAAETSPKDEVSAASKKLAEKASYSWRTTVEVPSDSPWRPGPTDGQTEKDGYTMVKMSFGDNMTDIVLKGDKAAVTTPEGTWSSVSELGDSEGPGRFLSRMVRNFQLPAAQAAEIAAGVKELKKEGEMYSGELTEEGAKSLLLFRRGGQATASNAKGSAKFWVKDGLLTKFEYKVQGTVSFNGNDRDVDRAMTTEIKSVGETKVTVPEEAKKKLS